MYTEHKAINDKVQTGDQFALDKKDIQKYFRHEFVPIKFLN